VVHLIVAEPLQHAILTQSSEENWAETRKETNRKYEWGWSEGRGARREERDTVGWRKE